MAHRSNQVVASQDRAPDAPDEPPPPRRFLIGWATALAALGVSTALVGLGVWLARLPLAEFTLSAALAERGAEADFHVVKLNLNGATLADVRFGAENAPDASIPLVQARWRWEGLSPRLLSVRVIEPRLRLRIDPAGRVSAGALDRIGSGPPGRRRPSLPRIGLEIIDGHALIEAPFGAVEAEFRSAGTLGEDFSAIARIAETTRAVNEAYALQRGAAELILVGRDDTLAFRLSAQAENMLWAGARAEDGSIRILGRVPLDLARLDIEAAWRFAALNARGLSATQFAGAAGVEALMQDNELALANWQAQGRADAAQLSVGTSQTERPRFEARAEGLGTTGRGRWTLGAQRFAGLAMVSNQPAAAGRFYLDANQNLTGDALVTFAQTALDAEAQSDLRAAFPDLASAPIGPTFAQAERALDAAADRFTLSIPLIIGGNANGPSISMLAPAEARAATGAVLRLSPLRQDAPALVVQWPGPSLHGAVALELSGGGAPNASLLLDTVDWEPDAPFEADGTLTLANWRTENASIDANEMGFTLAVQPRGGGRVDLRGPAHITGPLGEGEVRDLVATLDLAVSWGQGWRVTPNGGCLPMRLGGIDAAGLSFSNGDFALCPLNGALIEANASRNLSGGFVVRSLALNGRMAGPEAQPARLSARNIVGRFSGRTGNLTLSIEADTPALAIVMSPERQLAVSMHSLTANAHIADSWRIDGTFEEGSLTDPALPGSVSTLAGGWTAEPENGEPTIRVTAAAALLTANRPATDAERPLFNPLRLSEASAIFREGRIDAEGALVLDAGARQLARFVAHHDVSEGEGAAQVNAANLVFGPNLQPYDITERARGMVDNVRGEASATADINWTRDAIVGTGLVRLNGISLATATIPEVEHVRGAIAFDDLFQLTTPPGQYVEVAALNPGVEVQNGRVRFQLLPNQMVSIEQAEFDFASGTLAMSPTRITLGADETRFELTLRDVEATAVLEALKVPDLTATGQIEGSFPLRLTRQSAFIEGGVLRAQGEGGVISYTGSAGASSVGAARIAFDALRSFRYDALSLTLDGDLNGEVVSSIAFSGRNSGRPVDLGALTPIPGVGNVQVRGVPFDFNVRVTAPFRRLAQTAASISDPGSLLNQTGNEEPQEPVDQEAPTPR